MESIRHNFLTGWQFMRWFRLVFGILITIQAVYSQDLFSGIIGSFFLFQAVTNTGCCGAAGCSVNTMGSGSEKEKEVVFTEVKPARSEEGQVEK